MSTVNFYQITHDGVDLWSGGKEWQVVEEWRKAPPNSRLIVTLWDSEGDDAHLIGQQIDITELVGAIRGGWVW